ncbi:uncharacterized protein [Leptinotarsa decemlineata]|uniref:uncharacterized protein n=1 Tax=Leptinotarsa decemlineata TaxID=7539 RepID=UPI003D30C89F
MEELVLARHIFTFILLGILSETIALKNVRVTVPTAVRTLETVSLECEYDLEGEPLYTVKWYKSNKEFYRYIPKELPNTQVFPFSGIDVDLARSNSNKLVLRKVQPEVTGRYKCEVSSDAPNFYTVIDSGYMYVVDIPLGDPVLDTEKELLEVGATLKGNCSSPPSYPAANITWFLNGKQVNDSFVKRSQRQHPFESRRAIPGTNNRRVPLITDSALELEMDGNTFHAGKAKLVCKASIFNLYQKEKGIILEEERPKPRPSSVLSNREDKSGASKLTIYNILLELLVITCILKR